MASAYTNITTYRDPAQIDLSSTFKAQAYKQQNYDVNTAQTQQLINQYAGTDLLRDVDKQYFGERLNTLVNYINESGTRDWSRKSVANEIQNYVSTALDKNVMNAIASTQSFRKQQAEIADIKKNKPDLYSMQNEWFATQDFNRYLSSNEIGDTYRAQSYTPYTDVKKVILENADKLKDFGVEYYTDNIGGNSYFRRVGTFEKIDPETAKQYLSTMMDSKVMNQLYIDGQYAYKDTDASTVKNKYTDKLDSMSRVYDERLTELKTQMLGATSDKKQQYQTAITNLELNKNNLVKSKSLNLSKQAMADYLYRSDFENNWTGFLSYNRLTDWKIDDSGFQIQKYQTDIEMKNRDYNLDVDKFKADQQYRNAKMLQDDAQFNAEMQAKGFKKNQDGSYTLDPNNPLSGIVATDQAKELTEENTPLPFTQTKEKFYRDYGALVENVGGEIQNILSDPKNSEIQKRLQGNNPKQMASMLINSPSKYRDLYNLLSDNSKNLVNANLSSKQQLDDIRTNLNAISKDISEYSNAVRSSKTKESTRQGIRNSIGGLTLDSKGNVVKGDVLQGNHQFAQTARDIAVINNIMMSGNLSDDDMAKYRDIAQNKLLGTGMSSKQASDALDKLVYKKTYSGFWDGLGQVTANFLTTAPGISNVVKTGLLGLQSGYNILNYDTNDKTNFAVDFIKYGQDAEWGVNRRGAVGEISDNLANVFRANEDINSIGLSDIDTSKLSYDPTSFRDRMNTQLRAADKKVFDNKMTTFNKTLNIDMGSDYGKSIRGSIMAQLPVGTQLQENSNLQVNIDQQTGLASITAAVKDGKEYVPTNVQVKITDLPQSLLQRVDLNEKNTLYSASNPYSVKYSMETEIPRTVSDWSQNIDILPYEERTQAFQNPPTTQEDIIKKLDASFGKQVVDQNMDRIQKIMQNPVQVSLVPEQGQWTVVAKQNDDTLLRQATGMQSYDPKLIENYSNKIVTDAIEQRIKQTLYGR